MDANAPGGKSPRRMIDAKRRAMEIFRMTLTQPQREALFDLITLATYADSHLSLKEEALMESALLAEGWDSRYPKSLFLDKSRARAREAVEDEVVLDAYLASRAALFCTSDEQTTALGLIRDVIARDGIVPEEHVFLVRLNDAFPKPMMGGL